MEENPISELNPDGEIDSVKQTKPPIALKEDELKEVLEAFAKKTTISAVALIHHRISVFWKSVWFLIVLVSLSMSIYQAVELIKNYLRYPSFLTEVEKLNMSMLIPSITLCNQNIVNWERVKELNHTIRHNIENEASKLKKTENAFEIRIKLQELLMQEIMATDVDEREKILSGIEDWLVSFFGTDGDGSYFEYKENKSLHAYSYSPEYGNCVTINPGLTEKSKLRIGKKNEIYVVAKIKSEIEFPYLERIPGLVLSIHEPGTAPVLGWYKELNILPGEYVQIGIKVRDIKRLSRPYASSCIGDKEDKYKAIDEVSPYRSKKRTYSYSKEECMAVCALEISLEQKGCYLPAVAMNEKHKSSNVKLCSESDLDDVFAKIDKLCSELCPKRCRELLYEWIPKSSIIPERSQSVMDFLSSYNETAIHGGERENVDCIPLMPIFTSFIRNSSNLIIIQFGMDSNIYIYAEETAKYELEDIFGSIGGNLGLWIGLSIMSAFEIFELLTNIVVHLFRKMIMCRRS